MPDAPSGPTEPVPEVTMRLSALCARAVVDADGRGHGSVLDVRLVRDGPANVSGDAAVRIDGLVVGEEGWVEHFGLFRRGVHGPWLLKSIARLLGSERSYLPWEQLDDPHRLAAGEPVRFHGELRALPGRYGTAS